MRSLYEYINIKCNTLNESNSHVQGFDDYSIEEIIDIIKDYCCDALDGFDIDIVEIWLHGSRMRGNAKSSSDLDAVMFYKGNEREDDLFNILNNEDNDPLYINDIKVDINPIYVRSNNDIERYKKKSNDYDKSVMK